MNHLEEGEGGYVYYAYNNDAMLLVKLIPVLRVDDRCGLSATAMLLHKKTNSKTQSSSNCPQRPMILLSF